MTLREGNVVWTFEDGFKAGKYDRWAFYRRRFQRTGGGGTLAVDFVAIPPSGDTLWLVEAKDYTLEPRDKQKEPLPIEVARKARDTLAGLAACASNGADEEQAFAQRALRTGKIRIVLHLEQPANRTRLCPSVLVRADVQQKLRQVAKAIDPHPQVVDAASPGNVPWKVAWSPP